MLKIAETTKIVSPVRVWGATVELSLFLYFYFWFWWLSARRSLNKAGREMRLCEALDFSLFSHLARENSVQCKVSRFDCRARSSDDRDDFDWKSVFRVSPSRFDTLESSISCATLFPAGILVSRTQFHVFVSLSRLRTKWTIAATESHDDAKFLPESRGRNQQIEWRWSHEFIKQFAQMLRFFMWVKFTFD